MADTYLLIYRSIHDVMRAESALKRGAVPCKLVPVPTTISSNCGMALSVLPVSAPAAASVLADADARPIASFRRTASGPRREDLPTSSPESPAG